MKNILIGICLLVTTNIAFSQLTAEQEKLFKDVLATRSKKLFALNHENHAELNMLYDSNAQIIKTHQNLKFNKKQYLQSIAENKIEYDTLYDLKLIPQFYNNNKICILTGTSTAIFKKPTSQKMTFNFSDIYFLDDNNHWRSFYYHSEKPK